jgi:hypothetical protein
VLGAVSGWAAAVQQHTQFRDAPVSVAVASALALGGRVTGKLTKALRGALEYGRSAASAPPMLRSALYWFGAPSEPEAVHGDVGPIAGFRPPYHNGVSTMLSMAAYPVYVYGSGGGALFVPEMDEAAFPPVTKPSAPVRLVRRAAQLAFGLRPPP